MLSPDEWTLVNMLAVWPALAAVMWLMAKEEE